MPGRGGFRGRKAEQNLRSRKFEGSRSDSLGGKSLAAQKAKIQNCCVECCTKSKVIGFFLLTPFLSGKITRYKNILADISKKYIVSKSQ